MKPIAIAVTTLLLLLPVVGAIDWDDGSTANNGNSADSSTEGHMVASEEVISNLMNGFNTTASKPITVSDDDIDITDGDLADGEDIGAQSELYEEITLEDNGLDYLAAQDARYVIRANDGNKDIFPTFLQAWCLKDFADRIMPNLPEKYPFGIGVEKDVLSSRGDNWLMYRFSIPVKQDYKNLRGQYKFRLDGEQVVAQFSFDEGEKTTTYKPQVYTTA